MSNEDEVSEDEVTRLALHPDIESVFSRMTDMRDGYAEVLPVLDAPEDIDAKAFAGLLRGLYTEVLKRAGLADADPHQVALMATPESLLELATGGDLGPDNPLAALVKRG
jgi:hypothetical protein